MTRARRSGAGDELLLQQPDRRATTPTRSISSGRSGTTTAPIRKSAISSSRPKPISPSSSWIDEGGLNGRADDGGRHLRNPPPLLRTAARTSCCGSTDPETGERLRDHPRQAARAATSRSAAMSRSARARCRAFLSASRPPTAGSARPTRSLPPPGRITGCLWIHPFLDGNGRVARLMSYAMLLDALDTGGIWSIARGLARSGERLQERPCRLRPAPPQRSRRPRQPQRGEPG